MKRWGYLVLLAGGLVAAIALIGWARAYAPPLIPSASEDWSRGRILGVMPVSVRVDVQPGSDGVVLTWVDPNDRLHVAKLGARGQVVSDQTPSPESSTPREPRLLVGPENDIHLIWRETDGGRSALTYSRLDSRGSVQVGPVLLSQVGDKAESPNIAFNRRGEVEAFWCGQAGIYWTTLGAKGQKQSEPLLLVEGGKAVNVQVDQEGLFHLTWLQDEGANEKTIQYASLDTEQGELSQPEQITRLFLNPGQTVQSLVIGMDSDTGYILWVIQDMKYVTSSAYYAFFPLEIPRQKRVRDLELENGGNPLSLWAVRGQYETLLVALTETVMTSNGPQLQIGLFTLRGEETPGQQAWATDGDQGSGNPRSGELAGRVSWIRVASPIALHVPLRVLGYADNSQFAVPDSQRLQSGWAEGQYIVTASEHPSLVPSLIADAQGNLHLSWLETGGFGSYRVAYASTAPGVKNAYNRLTLWDVTDRALGLAVQFFQAVGLTPVLAIYWTLLPLGWLIVYLLITGREHLTTVGTWVAFGVSVLLEVTSTYLYYPHRSRMPPVLQGTGPLVTAGVGLLIAMLYLRKREEKHLFGAYFVFAIVHGLLQVMFFVLVR
jgi:hypothetical protein